MSRGRIEVVAGGMFSGKTEELVRRLRRAQIARKNVQAFKHNLDNRYDTVNIGSHAGLKFDATPVDSPTALMDRLRATATVVGIDEVQFFDPSIVTLCEDLANQGIQVIVAGLDQDSEGRPFGPMPALMAIADGVVKLHAVCMICGDEASKTYHQGEKTSLVEIGASQYEARCRKCWSIGLTLSQSFKLSPNHILVDENP